MNSICDAFGLKVPHGGLNEFIASAEDALAAMRESPYHVVLGRDFLHQRDAAAEYLRAFLRSIASDKALGAVYLEMNGFAINPGQWHFDAFGYESEGDKWDLAWLAEWSSESFRTFVLTGMEPVQEAFRCSYRDLDAPLYREICGELAEHLVTARFMELIAAAHEEAKRIDAKFRGLPILATAHDWDTVHRTE